MAGPNVRSRGREPRLVSRCRAELERPSGVVEAETEDLSDHGLYLRTEALLPVGEVTEVRITLPDGTYLALRVRVAHMLTPAAARALGRHAGLGLELIGPDTPSRLKLRAHLDGLRTELTPAGFPPAARLLVVDPSPPRRARITGALEGGGFHVTAVASATEALHACAGWRPAAVVAAADLGGMTGADLAYAMSEHATLSDVPLALVGDGGDLARLEAFRAGVRDYIPQPFLDEELVIRTHRLGATAAPAASAGLRGSLVDIGLGTLLSLLEFERKSGVLMLARTNELARLFVAEGKLLRVESSAGLPLGGRARIMTLLDWRDGQFEFTPSAVTGRDELGVAVTTLLLEHARVRDEQSAPIRQRR